MAFGTVRHAAWLAALGIVFGDLGTSPLCALQECFAGPHGANPQLREDVLGTVSLIVWSLLFIVTTKYLVFLMRIDNREEGGTWCVTMGVEAPHGGPHRAELYCFFT